MVAIRLSNSHTNVLIAAGIAHYNGGYFRQNDPPGRITVEADRRLEVRRVWVNQALGRACPDELWDALSVDVDGEIVQHDGDLLVIQAHLGS